MLTFHLSEVLTPKPHTSLTACLGEKSVGGGVYPFDWSNVSPSRPYRWSWAFGIGPWKWTKPSGMADTQEDVEAALEAAWATFLEKFGLELGPRGAAREGSLTLRQTPWEDGHPRAPNDFDIMLAGVVLGRLRYPSAQPPRWGWNVWLEPFSANQGGLDDTREIAMENIRKRWDKWLRNYGLQERT